MYRIKAKQRRELQRAIMRSIQANGLVDTYAMKDSIRVMTDSRVTMSGIYIKITALYYFRFHDDFAADGKCTKNNVCPLPIITEAFNSPKAQQTFADISQLYFDSLVESDTLFKSLGKFKSRLPIEIGFEFFGSDDARWNKAIAFDTWGYWDID